MRRMLEQQIDNLKKEFTTMGLNVESAIRNAILAFQGHDLELAQEVIENDETINGQETHLEKQCAQVIALQQPVASDLRLIISMLKASSDLERLGDHAVSVAKATKIFENEKRDAEIEKIVIEMAQNVQKMLEEIMNAYEVLDDKKAIVIANDDNQNNEYFKQIRKLSLKEIRTDADFAESGIDYLNVANHIERMGDYVTNLAEWIIYATKGKITELGRNDL
ncbi:phosphate signaling complex protein PhoU [Ligilactobacillus sp. WILCCON 0076]|uniref:Phosphate-specific transport system accessory protein PhoU n=1 Tax=Ligilactobacillus ubinensis TaxID=2876789 RepID=A0A9X2FHV4_9LACO|nr:phosphate signaling complex protein PhoU [Ligilactobacillus ubinensis]MCP0886307.1 phosphate signaling complex protein PhoU [Ligilactobacillus ubinensis]